MRKLLGRLPIQGRRRLESKRIIRADSDECELSSKQHFFIQIKIPSAHFLYVLFGNSRFILENGRVMKPRGNLAEFLSTTLVKRPLDFPPASPVTRLVRGCTQINPRHPCPRGVDSVYIRILDLHKVTAQAQNNDRTATDLDEMRLEEGVIFRYFAEFHTIPIAWPTEQYGFPT
ncbi:hypothetical protein RRG08_041754 [Elysia crispata]|uniref:Uncharacterized protein n=1 Tax=Elysia crispata TaxID=231223 RepID=A0AAE0YZ83_9GAST|nr:hypothetical protein RRG08_041754 [Elysia crispata]